MHRLLRSVSQSALVGSLSIVTSLSLAGAQQTTLPEAPRICPVAGCGQGPQFVVHISSYADIRLENGVLQYVMRDVLQNRGGRNAQIDYITPLPPHSAFHNLTMSINGEMIAGEIMAANKASQIYDAIVRTNRDPALVEWLDRNLLRTRIFPIFPAEIKTVELRIQALAERSADQIRINYQVGSKRGEASPFEGTAIAATFSFPDSAHYGLPYSPTHKLSLVSRANGRRTVTATGRYGDIAIILPVSPVSTASLSVISQGAVGENGYALIRLTPPAKRVASTPRDVVIAVDVSKSMLGQKFEMAKDAMLRLIGGLRDNDRFRVVTFADSVHALASRFLPVNRTNAKRAREFIDAITPDGATNTAMALENALTDLASAEENRLQLVVLLTDGAPTAGNIRYDEIMNMVSSRRGRARVFALGIGDGVLQEFLRDVTSRGHGRASFAKVGAAVDPFLADVFAARPPVLSNLKVSASGLDMNVVEIAPVSAREVYDDEEAIILARYYGSGSSRVVVTAESPDGPVSWAEVVQLSAGDTQDTFVSRLWATERVGTLVREHFNRCEAKTIPEIFTLGMKHGIPTPSTSYLVLEPGIQLDSVGRVINAREFTAGGVAARRIAGSDVVIQIRNPLLIAGYTQPMIIIDGVIQLQDDPAIASVSQANSRGNVAINPFDLDAANIKSIEVIRGAAAASLYGQRAANGVITITTKGGEKFLPLRPIC